jgi:dynein heavy chain
MNTVLDENRKLCLLNGETIKVKRSTNIIFETGSLALTSPATVSRTGVFYANDNLTRKWQSLLHSWLIKLD